MKRNFRWSPELTLYYYKHYFSFDAPICTDDDLTHHPSVLFGYTVGWGFDSVNADKDQYVFDRKFLQKGVGYFAFSLRQWKLILGTPTGNG